ncbi:MAG TPA: ferritin-like domain-containing protein [Flavisolibacter sp.]|jgi:rubrerythrin|nr:ferritin-like domain-containing protein [Flavisolibacter sp.]
MNLQNIFSEIEKVDPEVYERMDTRRKTMQRFSFIGKTLALAAVPSALGTMFKKAYGQTASDVVDVLGFAYLLENLEAEFYKKVVSIAPAIGVPTGAPLSALTVIRDHEVAHVNFLRTVLTSLGNTPATYSANSFDFSGGKSLAGTGPFAAYTTNYGVMLALAQTFEDTGVRAYKGQAPRLINNNDVLTAALQIHSVEARHASHIRQMRRNLATGSLVPAGVTLQPWITLAQSGIETGNAGANAAIQMTYAGEELTTQATVNVVNIGGAAVSANEASEAFDEPLNKQQVTTIVNPFII